MIVLLSNFGICRKKKYTSLTTIINENNKAILIFNNKSIKKEKIKTLPHDTKSLLKSINILEDKIKFPINIIGDKGYIINNDKIVNKNVKIITPKRVNQIIKNNELEEKLLKKRYQVENWFAKLKNFNRIMVRRDKLITTFMGFVYIGCICIL